MTDDTDTDGIEPDGGASGADTAAPTDGAADGGTDGADEESADGAPIGLVEARSTAIAEAETVLSDPVEDVIEVRSEGDGWLVTLEVLERSAVPDTQDILARYELTVDATGALTGYGLVERYKRGDMRGDL
jgi:hypothetical protein